MPMFRFDPVSLVLELPDPAIEDRSASKVEKTALEVADFNSRYLHERVHWIQHFSTFSGLLQVFNAEIQQLVLEQCMARIEDSGATSEPPFRAAWESEPEMLTWNSLELFGATMAGDRTRPHFETVYGPGWPSRLLDGAQTFSRVMNQLRENGFRFDVKDGDPFSGITVGSASFIDNGDGVALGSSLLLELHAGLAQIIYLEASVGRLRNHRIDPVRVLTRPVIELWDEFLDETALPNDWRSSVVCSIAAYLALNTPVAPFFSIIEEKRTLTDISPIPNFLAITRALAPLRERIVSAPCRNVRHFHSFALSLLCDCVGPDFFEVNLKFLGMAMGPVSYRPLEREDKTVLSFENDRPQYLASKASHLVEIAREEPMFVTCPGLLYSTDRKRFAELYARVSHSLEYRHDVGICPSPYLSGGPDLLEYSRQVAFALKAELCRALAHSDLNFALQAIGRYRASYPGLEELHQLGLQVGLHDLVLPVGVRTDVSRVLAVVSR